MSILLTTASSGGGGFSMIIILVVMIALMYFMMIRPQSKEKKRMNEMLNSLEVGDAVLTSSGFYGVVIEMTEQDVIVEFGNNKNCRIPMRKAAIVQVEKPYGAAAPTASKEKPAKVEKKAEEKTEPSEGTKAEEVNAEAPIEEASANEEACK